MFARGELEADLDQVGVLSLSETWDNMLLWSHYAKDHKGICIGFYSNIDIFGVALKVRYTEEFPVITPPFDSGETILEKSFLTKARCWEYEKEWRVVKRMATHTERMHLSAQYAHLPEHQRRALSDQRGATLYAFDTSAIASVTLGMRTPESDAIEVLHAIDAAGLNIPLFVIGPPGVGYRLTRHQFAG